MESEGQRDAPVRRGVGKGAVQDLSVDNQHVACISFQWHGTRELLAAPVLVQQRLDVDLAYLV